MRRYLLVSILSGAKNVNTTISELSSIKWICGVKLLPVKLGNSIQKALCKKERKFNLKEREILMDIANVLESTLGYISSIQHGENLDKLQDKVQVLKRKILK